MTDERIALLKGLHEAECLLEDRVPVRFRGKALQAVRDAIRELTPYEPDCEGCNADDPASCQLCRVR